MLKEHADKISASDKAKVEKAINDVKEAVKGGGTTAIKSANDKLNEAWQAVSAELYKAAAEKARSSRAQGSTSQGQSGPAPGSAKKGEGPVIDAEVVDENKN
jgi:molecular chaperone DnaK